MKQYLAKMAKIWFILFTGLLSIIQRVESPYGRTEFPWEAGWNMVLALECGNVHVSVARVWLLSHTANSIKS